MTRRSRRLLAAALAVAVVGRAGAAGAESCEAAIADAEARLGMPRGLLHAMGEVEAGYDGVIWPWSLNVGGRPLRFATRRQAEDALRRLRADGRRNIDAGCLQLNLQWAGAGLSVEDLIDPRRNVDRAVAWLLDLKAAHGSWGAAVTRYHSARPARMAAYECRVVRRWAARLGARRPDC